MQHYVAGDTSVHVLKGFAFVDQNGTSYAAPGYPLPSGAPIVATGSGMLALKAGGGSGPPAVAANAQAANAVDSVATAVTPGPGGQRAQYPRSDRPCGGRRRRAETLDDLLGHRRAGLAAHPGLRPACRPGHGDRRQQPDHSHSRHAGRQIPHASRSRSRPIGYTAKASTSLELQLVATTVAYVTPRLGGTVNFSHVTVVLPTAKGLKVLQQG